MAEAGREVVLALHYQNENCHPDGKVRLGVGEKEDAARQAMLGAARRLLEGARRRGWPVVHVRLAVRPDYRDVVPNTPLFRQWIELGAWQEGSWGVAFVDGLGPRPDELVVTHIRNDPFIGTPLAHLIGALRPRRLICAGVSTAYVVESTVRHATDLSHEVAVAADACSTGDRGLHEAALRTMALLAEVTTVDGLLARVGS